MPDAVCNVPRLTFYSHNTAGVTKTGTNLDPRESVDQIVKGEREQARKGGDTAKSGTTVT